MAFSIVGTPQSSAGAGPTLSVNNATGVQSGDVVLLFAMTETASAQANTPTGFTLIGDKAATTQSMRATAFYKVAGASEPGTYSVTGGSGTSWIELALIVIRGASATPLDVSASNTDTSAGTSVVGASITTTAIDELVWFAVDFNGGETMTVQPSGYTAQLTDTGNGLFISTKTQSASGATGTATGTLSASDTWITWHIGIKPAGGGGSTVSGSATVQANAALVESGARVIAPSGTILTPANAALAETARIVAAPQIAMQANAVLAVTGGLAGHGGGTIVANAALVETAARIQTTATPLQANATLTTAAILIALPTVAMQANAALSITGQVVTPSPVALAASGVLALAAAQVRAAPTTAQANVALSMSHALLLVSVAIQANAVLAATGHIPVPAGFKSPIATTALHTTLTGATAATRLTGSTVARSGLTGSTVARPLTGSTTAHTGNLTGSTVKE